MINNIAEYASFYKTNLIVRLVVVRCFDISVIGCSKVKFIWSRNAIDYKNIDRKG